MPKTRGEAYSRIASIVAAKRDLDSWCDDEGDDAWAGFPGDFGCKD